MDWDSHPKVWRLNIHLAHLCKYLPPFTSIVSKQMLPPSDKNRIFSWYLADEPVTATTSFHKSGTRLGDRETDTNTDERVNTARYTAYALMSGDLYGHDGLNPLASMFDYHICSSQTPAHTWGNDPVYVTSEPARLILQEPYQTATGSPPQCCYSISISSMVTLPVQAHLEKKHVYLFGAITKLDQNNPLRQIAIHWLVSHLHHKAGSHE